MSLGIRLQLRLGVEGLLYLRELGAMVSRSTDGSLVEDIGS